MESSLGGQSPLSFNLGSQLLSTSNQSSSQMESYINIQPTVPFSLGSQHLSSTNRQFVMVEPMPKIHSAVSIKPGPQNIESANKQSGHVEPSLNVQASLFGNLGSHQSVTASTHPVPKELLPKVPTAITSYLGSKKWSSTKKRTPHRQRSTKVQTPMFVNLGTQQVPSTKKRATQKKQSPTVQSALSNNLALEQLSSTNKLITKELSISVQTESFELVRSKLRESLAASLALVSDEQSKSQSPRRGSPSEAASKNASTLQDEKSKIATDAPLCYRPDSSTETLVSNEHDDFQKCDIGQNVSSDVITEATSNYEQMWDYGIQEFEQRHISFGDDEPFNNNFLIKDELLQENGLCWASDLNSESTEAKDGRDLKRPKLVHEEITADMVEPVDHSPETLATRIESELFRLFGGVNKKYKEKGRSLLFNLKDPKNPELREQVVSGKISPERLCSMTAEELASKELSEWRMAKAEEFAQMVVLPDSEVDLRRLVKKTHKGEFQVEFEQDDSVSVELAQNAISLIQIPIKCSETKARTQPKSPSKSDKNGESEESVLMENLDAGGQNLTEYSSDQPHGKSDFMQEFMVDELKDAKFLPQIVSLDEFMEALDSEPPFVNLTSDAVPDVSTTNDKNRDSPESKVESAPNSLESRLDPAHLLESKLNCVSESLELEFGNVPQSPGSKVDHADAGLADPVETAQDDPGKMDANAARINGDLKPIDVRSESDACSPDVGSRGEHVWEGLIQFNVSSLVTVVGSFRSGEKTSMKEWPNFFEIKGRVRLDAFEKFLQQLPLSRSRNIMVVQFCLKDGSPDSGRLNMCEAIEAYIADERVGFAVPRPGVELYLCPFHTKITQMLGNYLAKEHTETFSSTDNCLIGIVVWRKSQENSDAASQHKHGSSKKQSNSRKQHSNAKSTSKPKLSMLPPTNPAGRPPTNSDGLAEPEPMDDVPPGFGPASTGDEDDLPEFDFVQGRTQPSGPNPSRASILGKPPSRICPPPVSGVQQMRELVQKYGQSKYDDDEDDIPEWQPHEDNQPKLPPPSPGFHGFQQHRLITQHMVQVPPPSPPPIHARPQQLLDQTLPPSMPVQSWEGSTPIPQTIPPGRHLGTWPVDMGLPLNMSLQPHENRGGSSEQQIRGTMMNSRNKMAWRSHLP